jgi:5-methylcytosine-specific restriction protein A
MRRTTGPRPYASAAWQRHSRTTLAAWRQEHGDLCPGFRRPPHATADLTVDHTIPLGAGGALLGPTTVLCRSCNSRKAHVDRPELSRRGRGGRP